VAKRRGKIDIHKIEGNHPVTGEPVSLKWYRDASRYNNGATMYGKKYMLRYLLGYAKQQPYTQEELDAYKERVKQ